MRNPTNYIRRRSRAAMFTALVAVSGGLAGCESFLEVENPGAVEPPALESPTYIPLMVGGVIGDFQPAFAWTALWSGVFTDELRNHQSFFQNVEIDRRDVDDTNGTYILAVYNGLHRSRFLADSVASRLQVMLADSAGRNVDRARVLAYAGYTWTLLGEQYCETPINRSAPVPSDQLLRSALQRFDEAIQVATAARTAASSIANATARSRRIATADSMANFARVGAARAALNLSAYDPSVRQRAVQYARAVTPAYSSEAAKGFEFRAQYAREGERYTRRSSNPFWEFITDGRWFSLGGTPFVNLKDPRVPQSDSLVRTQDATRQFLPESPSAFSTYNGQVSGAPFDATSSIRIASALEARYVIAEVEGLNAANLAFVNQRRAVGGQAALSAGTSTAEYQAALREQRARDFYLDSHRMGDLRRYKKQGVNDPRHQFPSGSYYGSATVRFGNQECWPVPAIDQQR
jgi:hypothetical protein